MATVSAWGNLSPTPHTIIPLTDRNHAARLIQHSVPGLAYGMGRSYGDVCLNPNGNLWSTRGLDRFIAFNNGTGRLVCEAGVLLQDIQRLMIPRGWILPVTPGTQCVTVGGAIANDVHGKNHHVLGSFGNHVHAIKMVRTDGQVMTCGPLEQPDWFAATVGGLGLTGVILEAEIQLRRVPGPWLDTETLPYTTLEEFFELADDSEAEWEHTVAWVDCLSGDKGRGIFMRGKPIDVGYRAAPKRRACSIPFELPFSCVNPLSLRVLNALYYHIKTLKAGQAIVHYEPFFYPLDTVLNWNRIYGRKGFYQYQSVFPRSVGQSAIQRMLKAITQAGEGSFLAVLKTFGPQPSVGMLSFPQPGGVTLALDFPNRGERIHKLFAGLDAIVREANGRIYPAKDARMPRELFEAGYPQLTQFLQYRDPGISSGLSRRLMGS